MIVKLTEQKFEKEVRACSGAVLVEFYASWCPRCAMMEDVLRQFAEENSNIKVCQADAVSESRLAERYGIERVPAFIAYENGKPVGAVVGVVPQKTLKKLFTSDCPDGKK